MKANYIFGLFFLGTLYAMYLLYQPFLLSIIIATLLAVSTSHVQIFLEEKFSSNLLASIVSTIALALLFFAPLGYFLTIITIKLQHLDIAIFEHIYQKLKYFIDNLPDAIQAYKPQLMKTLEEYKISDITKSILHITTTLGGYSASFLKTTFLITVFYFFVQYYRHTFADFFKSVISLSEEEHKLLTYEISSVMSVVFYSIIVTAVFEGALFAILMYFFDYNALFFGIMYGFASLIPIVGGALMWIPLTLYELSLEHTSNAIIIALYSIIVISIIADTFIKPIIIRNINLKILDKKAKMNELLIFFAILAGLSTFGFWGMILGPAITSFFLALLKLLEAHKKLEGEIK